MRSLAALLPLILLAGCASDQQPPVADLAGRLAQPGMTVVAAEAALTQAGFHCGSARDGRTCGRNRAYYLVSTCVQRVNLITNPDTSPEKSIVLQVVVPKPACAGL